VSGSAGVLPNAAMIAAAAAHITIGNPKMTAYHRRPNRARTIRLSKSRTPGQPFAIPDTINAAISGPSGFGPDVVPRAIAMTHGYQENKKARAKNVMS
jgi:hypothetical protein